MCGGAPQRGWATGRGGNQRRTSPVRRVASAGCDYFALALAADGTVRA